MKIALDKAVPTLALLTLALVATAQDEAPPQQGAAAQGEPPPAAEAPVAPLPPQGCDDAAYAQFDFWVGEWTVLPWSGREVDNPSRNRIEKILDGCALSEQFAAEGYSGNSITFYDRYDERWHQTWVASDGDPLYLVGGWRDGKMVLADDPQDERPKSRLTWQPLDGGQVRQTWELSRDGGETWQTVFDGRYVPAGGGR